MTDDARFFSGDVIAQHWSDGDGGAAVMAAKKKPAKKTPRNPKPKPKPKPKATRRAARCPETGKKTCRLCRRG